MSSGREAASGALLFEDDYADSYTFEAYTSYILDDTSCFSKIAKTLIDERLKLINAYNLDNIVFLHQFLKQNKSVCLILKLA